MPNEIKHFAINADDTDRAQGFYGDVFGWTFTPWGPPGFAMIETGGDLKGALQQRRELLPDTRTNGFEGTIAVERDVDEVADAVRAAGGKVLMEKTTIAGVGDLIFFADTEGNIAGAMRYDPSAG